MDREDKKKSQATPPQKRWRSSVEKIFSLLYSHLSTVFYHFCYHFFSESLLTVVALGLFGQLCLVHIVLALSHCVEAFSVKLIHRKNYLNAPGTCGVDFACCLWFVAFFFLYFSSGVTVSGGG